MVVYRNIQNTHRPTTASLTLVIKVGTSSICDEVSHYPLLGNLSRIVETIIQLKRLGHRVVLVTSAAVGTGLRRLNLSEKPKKLASIQVKHVSIKFQMYILCLYCIYWLFFSYTGYCCCWSRALNEHVWWPLWSIQSTSCSNLADSQWFSWCKHKQHLSQSNKQN